jgi:hypothetical protein
MRIITFKKIDRRYNGGNIYQYMIETHGMNSRDQIKTFNEIRQWCEVIWGRSYELHDAWAHDEDWPIWAWANDSKDSKRAIYLKTDKEYMLAKLRWE